MKGVMKATSKTNWPSGGIAAGLAGLDSKRVKKALKTRFQKVPYIRLRQFVYTIH